MTTKPPPRCKAILLCKRTVRDAVTGWRDLLGVFDELALPRFPGRTPSFKIYLQLLDCTF